MKNYFLNKNKGFTLLELLVVVSLFGLLSTIVLASISSAREKGRIAAAKQFAASTYHALGDQLVGAWNFDECAGTTVSDSSGSGNNGTFVGTPLWSHTTPSGTGCSLNTNNIPANYVQIPYFASSSLQLSSNFTVSMWIYLTLSTGNIFIHKGNDSVNNGLAIGYQFSGAGLQMLADGAINGPGAVPGDDFNKWHQITAVVDTTAGKQNLYIDGKLVASRTGADAQYSWANTNDLRIGAGNTSLYGTFGLIDEVKVYAKNFSAMDVRNIYLAEKDSFSKLAHSRNKSKIVKILQKPYRDL